MKRVLRLLGLISLGIFVGSQVNSQNIGLVDIRRADQVITVGGSGADIPGFTSGAINMAIDALKSRGGGTVKLNPGTYEIIGPVKIASGISLMGSGQNTRYYHNR